MSMFAKRKARAIKVVEDEEPSSDKASASDVGGSSEEIPLPSFGSRKKPMKQSGLRKSLNYAAAEDGEAGADLPKDDDNDGPVVVRPSASRTSSLKQKKRPQKSSKLSFTGAGGDTEDAGSAEPAASKNPSFGQRVMENSALKRGIANRGLPLRSFQEQDDKPRYSREYLDELQSSTPTTPQGVSSHPSDMGDEMELDASELEGALIVETTEARPVPKPSATTILTDAEIKEKKERRARLAKENDFLSVEGDDEEDSISRKKKDDTRLIAEDEDLGEGFDDYVEDGGLSLGKKAERERRKRERQQMAEMINAAEGNSSDSSNDSDAERRIAFEAAQTRAGMDGLKKPHKTPTEELLQIPPKITALPSLAECLITLQASMKSMEEEIKARAAVVQQLQQDKNEILKREAEVQALLDETGKKYQQAMGRGNVEGTSIDTTGGASIDLIGERGLESLGT